MKPYAYRNARSDEPYHRRLLKKISSFALPDPAHHEVQKHIGLLVGQAIFLMLLALVYIGFEAYTVHLEKGVLANFPRSHIVREQIADTGHAQRLKETNDASAVLGTQELRKMLIAASQQETADIFLQKESFVIALTGDSMVETMGTDSTFLKQALEKKYPDAHFFIYNYAKGARNVSENLKDFHEPFNYKDRHYESIDELKPDIIIVGSSAYNLFDPHDVNKHWLEYTRLLQEALKVSPHVYMLAEPAPIGSGFGLGADGVMWEPNQAWIHTGHIIEQLKNVSGLSQTLQLPLIDAYTPSLDEGGQRGKRELINTGDNIHLSDKGHEFVADLIVKTVDMEEIR
jgi:hypothetical protein